MKKTPERRKASTPYGLDALSTPPRNVWPEGVLFHGTRIVLVLGLAVMATALFPPVERMQVSRYTAGQIAEEAVIAQIPFAVPKTPEELERDRQEARAAVPPTFNHRPAATDSMTVRLEDFFQRLDSLARGEPEEPQDLEPMDRFLASNSIELGDAQLRALADPATRRTIRQTALEAVQRILPEGVADAAQLQQFGTSTITVREGPELERSEPREEVLTPRGFYDQAVEMLPPETPPNVQEVLRLVLIQFLDHSLELNVQATEMDRQGAAQAVATTKGNVLRDEAIVRANQQIGVDELEKLRAYEEALRNAGRLEDEGVDLWPLAGATLQTLLLLLVFGLLLFFFRNEVYSNLRWVLLVALLVASYLGIATLIARNQLPYELLPVAFVTLSVAILWDGRMALVLALVLAVLTGAQPPFEALGFPVIGLTLLGGAAAAMSVRAVRRRAQTWVFTALIAGAYALGMLALVLLGDREPTSLLWGMGAASVNALLSAILAMGFLPVFELFTGITTDQTLLEWADPNQSLLKRLSMEAPGTYAHTINVANLAEAAATAVGANGLLCRVGLYYHDVGKMLKPHYFVENQPDARNPHDRLKPDTSAAIVKEHVTEGYRMAREANVPDLVADFIPEHHGTQKIGFFWEKAVEEYGEENLDPEDFSYPGPRPRSKETAIAMLADSVESATRALQDPTAERVRDLIENLVDAKIADGQLDESPLTLREIRQIKEQFIKVLSGIYHHRIDYPQTRHLTDRPGEGGGEPGGEEGGASGTGADAGAEQHEIEGLDGAPAAPAGRPPGPPEASEMGGRSSG